MNQPPRGSATADTREERARLATAHMTPAQIAKFWIKVREQPKGCWYWSTGTGREYGNARVGNDDSAGAHRVAYELVNGPIPEGYEVDHLCRNPSCVRPSHLEAVTPSVNKERARRKLSTHCGKGHLYDDENTLLVRMGPSVQRYCRACGRVRARERRERVRA